MKHTEEFYETHPRPAGSVPVYLPEELFRRLRDRADRAHTTVNGLVIRILSQTLGPPEPPSPRFTTRGGPAR